LQRIWLNRMRAGNTRSGGALTFCEVNDLRENALMAGGVYLMPVRSASKLKALQVPAGAVHRNEKYKTNSVILL
jgi:hypothetical protein